MNANRNRIWKWASLAILLTMVVAACNFSNLLEKLPVDIGSKEPTATEENLKSTLVFEENPGIVPVVFAEYPLITYSIPEKFTGGYSLPLSAGSVTGLDAGNLTVTQKEALLANGFVVTPPVTDPNKMFMEFYQAYESTRYSELPVFITTDSIFHVYHLVFDKMLRDLERESFIPLLDELTAALVSASQEQLSSLTGTELEELAARNLAYFVVASNLLGKEVDVPEHVQQLADAELALIEEHSQNVVSPIWLMGGEAAEDQLIEDYSQYIPRGHYTRSEELKTYFKTMMWYGRLTYRLKIPAETQRALLMIQAMRSAVTSSGKPAMELWSNIYDPTVFIVGKADDLSITEYGAISDQVYGSNP